MNVKTKRLDFTLSVSVPSDTKAADVADSLNAALDEPPCNWEPWQVGAVLPRKNGQSASPVESRKLKPRGLQLLECAPVLWDQIVSEMTSAERQEAERFLSGVAERSARLCGYLDARGAVGCGDNGHADGVRESNKKAAKVRRALGFTQARNDINF